MALCKLLLLSVLLTLAVNWPAVVQGQDPGRVVHEVIGLEDGLPNRFVYALHRTRNDLLFLAHSRGLHYYDGFQFHEVDLGKVYRTQGVLALAEDRQGRIWLADRSFHPIGVQPLEIRIYDPVHRTLTSFWDVFPEFRKQGYAAVTAFNASPEGLHLVLDRRDHFLYADTFAVLGTGLPAHWSWRGPGKDLWLLIDHSLQQVSGNRVIRKFPLPEGTLFDLKFDQKGLEILMFDKSSLFVAKLDPSSGNWEKGLAQRWRGDISVPGGHFEAFVANGWQWRRNLIRLELTDPEGEVRWVQGEPAGQTGDWLGVATALHLDHRDEMWYVAEGKLHHVYLRPSLFREQFLQLQPPASVRAITTDTAGSVFLATYKGLYRMKPGEAAPSFFRDCPIGYSFTRDRTGQILMGTHSSVIRQITPFEEGPLPVYGDANNHFDKMILCHDPSTDRLWCGTPQGLMYEDHQGHWSYFPLIEGRDSVPYIRFIQRLDDRLWIGSDAGLFSIGSDERPIQHSGRDGSLRDVIVLHMSGDKDHYFIATRGQGLAIVRKKDWSVRFYTRRQGGLASDVIYAALPDEFGWLWMPSESGLMRMDLQTKALQVFTTQDGLPENEFNTNAFYRDEQGRILLGTLNGMVRFHPRDIPLIQTGRTSLYFDAVLINGAVWDEGRQALATAHPHITLPGGNMDWALTAHYSELGATRKLRIGYRLKDSDQDWVFTRSNVLHLPANYPGSYVFEIGVFPQAGNLPLEVRALTIEVPFPWRTGVAWAMAIFLITGLTVWAILRRRTVLYRRRNQELQVALDMHTRDLKAQTQLLQESNRIKDRMLSILGHELRNPLIGFRQLSAKLAFLIRKDDRPRMLQIADSIETQSVDLLARIDNLMEWARIQRGQLDLQPTLVDIEALAREQMLDLQTQADAKAVQLQCFREGDSQIRADVNSLRFIIRNLLSNAIKFSHAGKEVLVCIRDQGQAGLLLQVRDEGIGMDELQLSRLHGGQATMPATGTGGEQGSGLGWTIIRELILRMGAHLEVRSSPGTGTEISITFPFDPDHRRKPAAESIMDILD